MRGGLNRDPRALPERMIQLYKWKEVIVWEQFNYDHVTGGPGTKDGCVYREPQPVYAFSHIRSSLWMS